MYLWQQQVMHNSGQGADEATAISAGDTNNASGGAMPPDDEDGPHTKVKDSTTGRLVPNKDFQLTRKEFETNLENNGFTRKPTSNETITNYLKDDMKYTVRDVSKSHPGDVTVDVYRSNQLVQKIRLTGKP